MAKDLWDIGRRIYLIRGQRVMLDADLADIYGVTTRHLNQAVRRNKARFPLDFMFQLNAKEAQSLRSQSVTSKKGRGGRRYRPYAFTDGHAEMGMTQFSDDLNRLGEFVDREIMEGRYWNDTAEQPDRKRRRQAEFLIRESFPWKLIREIGVHDAAIAEKVAKLIANEEHEPAVEVRPEWYY